MIYRFRDETDKKFAERIAIIHDKWKKAEDLCKMLDIPFYAYTKPEPEEGKIKVTDLYDILMDEEKLKVLVSKLKLKAFW